MTVPVFPAIIPTSASYDFGMMNITEEQTVSGPVRFRHSTDTVNYSLTLDYNALQQPEVTELRNHYLAAKGTHLRFRAPTEIWGLPQIANENSTYRYAGPPEEQQFGIYTRVTVSLIALIGFNLAYILDGNAAIQPELTSFTSPAFTGNAPFVVSAGDPDPDLTLAGRGAQQ